MNPVTVGSLDQCTAPALLGVSGADPAWHSGTRQVKQRFPGLSHHAKLRGSTLTTPPAASRAGVKRTASQPWVFSAREVLKSEKKISGQPRELNPEPPLQGPLLLYLFMLKCQQNCFTYWTRGLDQSLQADRGVIPSEKFHKCTLRVIETWAKAEEGAAWEFLSPLSLSGHRCSLHTT